MIYLTATGRPDGASLHLFFYSYKQVVAMRLLNSSVRSEPFIETKKT